MRTALEIFWTIGALLGLIGGGGIIVSCIAYLVIARRIDPKSKAAEQFKRLISFKEQRAHDELMAKLGLSKEA